MGITSSEGKKGLTDSSSPSEMKECAPEGASFSSLSESETAIGTTLIGSPSARPVHLIGTVASGVPPFPGQSIVGAAIVPHPPLLKKEAKAPELVAMMMGAFKGALEAVYDVRLPRRKKATVKAKDRKVLLEAAAILIEKDIPPATWCYFRIDRYKNAKLAPGAKRPAHPPLAYVFSKAALTEKRWQFRAAWGDGLIGGRVVFGPKQRALLQRYREMCSAINNGATRADATKNFFPADTYWEAVDAVKLEINEAQNKLLMQVERGVYVWQ